MALKRSEKPESTFLHFIYRANKTREISFPIGGIGTGCIGLAGNGRLIDWEIFNRPNKGSINGVSHFAIKAEANGKLLDARVLNGDLPPPYTGELNKPMFQSFGFGPPIGYMAGLPHFRDFEFEGTYPIAKIRFSDEKFPGKVQMIAFNPFIPLNDLDSSIPAAFFEIDIENTSENDIVYSVCLVVQNPLPAGTTVNVYGEREGMRFIKMSSTKIKEDDPEFGDLTIATDASDVSYQEYGFRGTWFDGLYIYWRDFTSPGKFRNRRYPQPQEGIRDHAILAVHLSVKPGETGRAKFIISWNFPNCYNYWNPEKTERPTVWKNYYAKIFKDSVETASYCLKNWDSLYEETVDFRDSLFTSTLPPFVIDAVSANISILKSPTVLRLENGSLYGFEGCHPNSGCCEGSCMHVWNYAYTPLFLFPKLDRSMWDLHYKYDQREDGRISFRLQLPLGRDQWSFPHAAVDGQFGSAIRAYAYWKFTGDDEWLKSNWQSIKKSIEYAWAETNEDKWDLDKDGVLEGRQHNTLDMELFGPNSWLTGLYLAALKAGGEIAEYLGEMEKAKEYKEIFNKGKRWVEDNLFNGEYFHQLINLKDKSILEKYSATDPRVVSVYWDDEHEEIKYQIGEGCGIDQVLAQWHANLCNLGKIFDKEKVKTALKSIYKYNFKRSVRDFFNPCRIFSLNDEAGTIICSWPEGKPKPIIPVPYAEETWCGTEYAVASHMIQEGLIDEGLEIVRAVRDRYDGEKRNPWNEIECGSNYARSMSSYALLLALSGFKFDMVRGCIEFNPPRIIDGIFRCFWSTGTGWGTFEIKVKEISIVVKYGSLKIKTLNLPFLRDKEVREVNVSGKKIRCEKVEGELRFTDPVVLRKGDYLMILISTAD
ncbi:MAG: GH116 family glycosyl-hydrolase [Candidatus Bathyarchaeia archaeon]